MLLYFSNGGDDTTGTGTQANPYKTVAKANTLLAAWTSGAFDGISFLGGQIFSDAALAVPAIAGTVTSPFVITSHGTGRAKLKRITGTAAAVVLTGASYVSLQNISVESITGSGVASNQNCITLSACTGIVLDRVDTLGGETGVASTASTFSARQTTIRYPWLTGISNNQNAQILEDVEVYGAGYDTALNLNAAAAYGLETKTNASAVFYGNKVRLLRCKGAIHLATAGTSRIRRLWNRTELATQGTQITIESAALLELYDSIQRLDGTDGATPYFGFTLNATGSTLRAYNCTFHSTTAFGLPGLIVQPGGVPPVTITAVNSVFSSSVAGTNVLLSIQVSTTRSFTKCRFYSAFATPIGYEGGFESIATFIARGICTSCSSGDPGYANGTLTGPDFARIASTSTLVSAGNDLSAAYAVLGYQTVDYFGLARLAGYWSIGASDYLIATLQSFSEGAGQAALDGLVDYDCFASLRDVPAFGNFPAVDHELSAVVRFELGVTRIGIWMLGGRAGQTQTPPSNPITTSIYQHTFDSGGVVALEDGERWDIGLTPGTNDPRRVIFEIKRVGMTWEVGISGSVTGAHATTFSAVTNGAAVVNGLAPNKELKLTLKAAYKGRVTGPAGRSDYRFDLTGLVDDVPAIVLPGVTLPQGWIEGHDVNDAVGPSSWAGIFGRRTGATNAQAVWKSFGGKVTGAVTAISIPSAPRGEVRPKDYAAFRWLGGNRISNGGFTSFPRTVEVTKFTNAIETLDPTYVAPATELPVHVIFLIDASGSMQNSGRNVRARRLLQKAVDNLPTDGSVILTMILCSTTTVTSYWVATQVIDAAARAAISAQMPTFGGTNIPNGSISWPTGVQFATQAFQAGVSVNGSTLVGAKKVLFVVSDQSGYPSTAPALAVRDALHALTGLSEVSILSVDVAAGTLSGYFAPLVFPAGIQVNAPRDPALSADTAIPSSVTIPDTLGAIALSTVSLKRPSLTATQGLTGNPAADQIGIDAAAEVQRWINEYLATYTDPPAAPTVFRNAYEAWPALDAAYAFDVRPGVSESSLGAWTVTGAASIEVRPQNSSGDVIHSRDGGNVARITLSAKGTLELKQIITDARPFRGDWLTVAYSGMKGTGSPRVAVVVIRDGVETETDVSYGGFFGNHSRRVARSLQIEGAVKELAVAIRIKGNIGESVLLSGVAVAQGRYDFDLPYSESVADVALPRGCVFMVAGESCPPGFRPVPGMDGRNAYAFTGDPNFYRREFASSSAGGAARTGPIVEVVLLVDGSATQSATAARSSVLSWLTEMVNTTLPKSGQVRVSIVFSNAGYPGYVLLTPTVLTVESAASEFATALNALNDPAIAPNFAPPSGDRMSQGFDAALPFLLNSDAPVKMLFYNTDASFDHAGAALAASFSAIVAVPDLVEVSAAVIGSTRAAVIGAGGESLIYPAPSSEPPGIIFEAIGGAPGFALPGTFAGQPYQAGAYVAEVFGRRVRQQIAFITSGDEQTFEDGTATNLGGQEFHDHANGTQFGSSTDEPDGFEDPTEDPVTTAVPLPTRDTAVIKPYPYHVIPSQTRPEDPPVYAVGPLHTHSLDTKMRAMPPSFPVLFCEKL